MDAALNLSYDDADKVDAGQYLFKPLCPCKPSSTLYGIPPGHASSIPSYDLVSSSNSDESEPIDSSSSTASSPYASPDSFIHDRTYQSRYTAPPLMTSDPDQGLGMMRTLLLMLVDQVQDVKKENRDLKEQVADLQKWKQQAQSTMKQITDDNRRSVSQLELTLDAHARHMDDLRKRVSSIQSHNPVSETLVMQPDLPLRVAVPILQEYDLNELVIKNIR